MSEFKARQKRHLEVEETKGETKEEKQEPILKKSRGFLSRKILPGREKVVENLVMLGYPISVAEIIAESINRCEYFECGLGEPRPFDFGAQSCIAPCQYELCLPWWQDLIYNSPNVVEFEIKGPTKNIIARRNVLDINIILSGKDYKFPETPFIGAATQVGNFIIFRDRNLSSPEQKIFTASHRPFRNIDTLPQDICDMLEVNKERGIKISIEIMLDESLDQVPVAIRFPERKANGYYFVRSWQFNPITPSEISASIYFPPEGPELMPYLPPELKNIEEE